MGKVRDINAGKYGISKKRFRELYYHCLQYDDWVKELQYIRDTVKSAPISDMPMAHEVSDPTGLLALRRAELSKKCKILEETAMETDPDIGRYILEAVTHEGVTYNYLRQNMNIPCGKDMYYNRRRKFYWLLDKKYKEP